MYSKIKVSEEVYYIGVNDRKTHLFENLWPIENGVAYNSFIINDEKVALIDTVERSMIDEYVDKIQNIIGGNKKVDYLIINHMEPDHSGAIAEIIREYPGVKIVGNKMTFALLKAFFGITSNLLQIEHGGSLDLGKRKLFFYNTPWLHWPETMMTYDSFDKILFSGDAFGSYGTLDGGIFDDEINIQFYEEEMRRYYSNIVGKYSKRVQDALCILRDVDIKIICSTHGPVWRSQIQYVLNLYNDWSSYKSEQGVVIVVGTMYGNTERMAEIIARRLAENGIKNIRIFDSSKTHLSYILRDIWKYKGVILGSCAYNAGVFPTVEILIHEMEHLELKDRLLGIFGTSGWNGAGVKGLLKFAERIGWEQVSDAIEAKGAPDEIAAQKCLVMADAMAKRLKEVYA